MKAMRIPTITGLHLPRRMGLLLLPFPPMVLKDFLEPMAFWFKNTLKEAMVQMDISASDDMETDINNILETLNIPLEDMAEAGELSSGSVSIEDLEHVNILQDERLDLVISFVPRGYVREFRFSLAMENPYRN